VNRRTCTVSVLLCLSLAPALAGAAVITVHPDGTGDAPTIQAAIELAAPGDEVVLSPGVFAGPGNRDVSFLGKAVTVRGTGGAIVDCEGSQAEHHRGFRFDLNEGTDSVLQDLTVRGGFHTIGGAVRIQSAAPHLVGCTFVANATYEVNDYQGGAVSVDWSSAPTFTGCTFRDNVSYYGGAIAVNHFSTAAIEDCWFEGNVAAVGGAVWGNGTTKVGCVFLRNEATSGGAVWQNGWNTDHADRCTFAFNSAPQGSAYHLSGAYAVTLERCLIVGGAGSTGIQAIGAEGQIALTCCDLFGNAGGDWVAPFAAQIDLAGNFSAPPCFCDPDLGDLHLCADSWCLPGHHPWGCSEPVGALGEGCGGCDCPAQGPVATEPVTWSDVKARYGR